MIAIAAMLIAVVAASGSAQRPDRAQGRAAAPGQPGQGALERQFRERLANVVQRRLNLNDAQMRQLGQVNDRYEGQRMRLLRQERLMRQELRAEVLLGDAADQTKVANLLDRALEIQRQRLDLTQREQRELAGFMSPVQRAQYFGIQDDLRRRLEEARQQRRPGAPARRPPPP
jgi:Spy/CpxP family protein refolding chaperone